MLDSPLRVTQAALEANLHPSTGPETRKRKSFSHAGMGSVTLKQCLQACLLGSDLPEGQGLLEVTPATFNTSGGFAAQSAGASRDAIPFSPRVHGGAPPETHPACALMQGFAEEGVRIRDLLLTLLDMYQGFGGRGTRPSAAEPAARSWRGAELARGAWVGAEATRSRTEAEPARSRTGAEVVATVRSTCDARRKAVAELIGAFLEWLADNPWIWGAAEGRGLEAWEDDITAAAMAVSLAGTANAPLAGERGFPAESVGKFVTGNGGRHGDVVGWAGSGGGGARLTAGVGPDSTDLLDRIVAGAAAATADADADTIEWLHVLSRLTSATGPVSLGAYAAACVEKSVALGGQAPFRVAKKWRFSQAGGKELWGLLEGARDPHGDRFASGEAPAVAVLVRTAAAAVAVCRKLRCVRYFFPCLAGLMFGDWRILVPRTVGSIPCIFVFSVFVFLV